MSTRSSLPELQPAIFTRLAGSSALMAIVTGVFDFGAVPVGQPFPYITLGDATETPLNAFGTRGYVSSLTLHIWDNTPGFLRCYQILGLMNGLLDQQILSLATQNYVYCLYDFSTTLNDPGLDNIRHMPVRYLNFSQEGLTVATQDVNLLQVGGTVVSSSNPVPISGPVTSIDGGNVTIGNTGDTAWSGAGAGSQVAILKKLVSLLSAALSVSGTVTANAGTNTSTALLALESGGNLAAAKTDLDALVTSNSAVNTAVGTQADTAWSGSGSGSEIAILKKIVAELAGTLTASVSGTVAVTNFPSTQTISGTVAVSSLSALVAGSALIGNVELVDAGGANKAAISASGAVKVDNSGVTQPISGTVAATQSGTWTIQPVNTSAAIGASIPANAFYAGVRGFGDNLQALRTVGNAGITNVDGDDVLAAGQYLYIGGVGLPLDLKRTPNIFKTVTATASGDTAVWTPTSGFSFRLMRYKIEVTGNAATSGGAVISIVLRDAATAIGVGHSVFVPSTAGSAMGIDYQSGWIVLDNGKKSAAANNALNVNLSAALTSGVVRVIACGIEE